MTQPTQELPSAARIAGKEYARQIIATGTPWTVAISEIRRLVIAAALAQTKNNKVQAAKLLQLSRNALLNVIRGKAA